MNKKNKVRGLTLHDIKTYKATLIKTVEYWFKDRQIYSWNRIEYSDTDIWSKDFDKRVKAINAEMIDFSTNIAGSIG